jgi:hypothetical protein
MDILEEEAACLATGVMHEIELHKSNLNYLTSNKLSTKKGSYFIFQTHAIFLVPEIDVDVHIPRTTTQNHHTSQ